MKVNIRVFRLKIQVQFDNGLFHWYYDWPLILDLIRPEDVVQVHDWTGQYD